MPFFSKNKVLLIHIPKTGGTSIEKYFAKRNNIELSVDFIYHRYYEQSIQRDFEQTKKAWKKIMNEKTIHLEKTQIQELKSRKNSIGNDDSSNEGEELQTIKENLPEYKTFKKIRLCKELKHSLQHMTWIELCKYKHILFEKCFHHILSHNSY